MPPDLRSILTLAQEGGKPLPLIMGIINLTPDSFSQDGLLTKDASIVDYARHLVDSGADILDIGASSTRPGSKPVPLEEERSRLFPAIEALSEISVPLSIDTRRPEIFQEALPLGASLINDVGGLMDPGFMTILKENPNVMAVVMHMQGTPETMQRHPTYTHVISEVRDFLRSRKTALGQEGIDPSRLIFDPGLGFGKTLDHNLALLRQIEDFSELGPILVGPSRKRFLDDPAHPLPPEDRDISTGAVVAWCTLHKTAMIRTHRPDIAWQVRRVLRSIEGTPHV